MNTNLTIRPADEDDARHLANLIILAGDGLPLHVWEDMREGDETAIEVGCRRAARSEGAFSYVNADMATRDGEVISTVISYPLSDEPEPIRPDEIPPMFLPLQELENLVAGTWYVNVLATYATHRKTGAASALLDRVGTRARKNGYDGLSLITGDINPALDFYRRLGFSEVTRRGIVKQGWDYDGREWVLLHKPL